MGKSIFTAEEIRRRWEAVWDATDDDIECIIAPSFHNSYYLSGTPMIQYGRWAITVLFRDGGPLLVLPEFEREYGRQNSPIEDVQSYRDQDGASMSLAVDLVVRALRDRHIKSIGLEAQGTPTAMYFMFKSAMPDAEFADVTGAIDGVRIVSSEEETAYLRAASRICDVGMDVALKALKPGVEESWLCAQVLGAMEEQSSAEATVTRVECYMQQGDRSIAAHAPAMSIKVVDGSVIVVNVQCHVLYTMAGVERMVMVGDVPPSAEYAYSTVHRAFELQRAAVRPGVSFGDLYKVAKDVFVEANLDYMVMTAGLVRSYLDVGGGRMDSGNIRPGNDNLLQSGMVLSIEPWSAIPDFGSHRHCEMVLVTEDGWEPLTKADSGILRIS